MTRASQSGDVAISLRSSSVSAHAQSVRERSGSSVAARRFSRAALLAAGCALPCDTT
jgi:hypothetical protein